MDPNPGDANSTREPATQPAPAPLADPEVERVLGIDRRGRVRRWIRRIFWLGVLAALVVGGAKLWRNLNTPIPIQYRTEPVQRGDLVVTVTATGRLDPLNEIEVGAEISGRIARVLADFNDPVAAGQPLAELDTDVLEAQVAQARAQLAIARASRSEAEAAVTEAEASRDEAAVRRERIGNLFSRDLATAEQRDTAEAAAVRADAAAVRAEAGVETAQAQVRAANASLQMAETNLDKATIRSPIDGIVLARLVEEGQTVVSQLQAAVLFRIAEDLAQMELVANVDEADVGRIAIGQSATFTVSAYPDRQFEAHIVSLRNAPLSLSNVVTYETILEVDNSDLALHPGMTATVEIITERYEDRLLVPNAALRFTPPELPGEGSGTGAGSGLGSGSAAGSGAAPAAEEAEGVWVLRDGVPVRILVVVGPTNGTVTAVEAPELTPGTELLVDVATPEP